MSNELARQVDQVEITDKQRAAILAACQEDRTLGHARAARAAGVEGTTGQIRYALAQDADFQEGLREQNIAYLQTIGLGVDKLLEKLAYVVSDDGNSSQLRAIERGLTFHGIYFHDKQQVEVTGRDGAAIEIEDRSATLADVARVLEAVGALAELSSGSTRAALPAAPDILAEPR